jgi:hypothetical protein
VDDYVRERLEESGIAVPATGTITLFHAGSDEKLTSAERTNVIPGSRDEGSLRGTLRVYLATSPEIGFVVPHADGVIAAEVDVDTHLELGLGDSPEKDWVELMYDVPSGQTGLHVKSVRRLPRSDGR